MGLSHWGTVLILSTIFNLLTNKGLVGYFIRCGLVGSGRAGSRLVRADWLSIGQNGWNSLLMVMFNL